MDISMPRMDGIEATRRICRACPHTQVVMLTIYNSGEHIQRAIKAGAAGYVLKDAEDLDLVRAIKAVAFFVCDAGEPIPPTHLPAPLSTDLVLEPLPTATAGIKLRNGPSPDALADYAEMPGARLRPRSPGRTGA